MAENKTKVTEVRVDDFLEAVADPVRRADGKAVRALMERVTGEPAKMWGPSIVGFGSYHYKYESGREGDMCLVGFSPRSSALVLYARSGAKDEDKRLKALGKFKTGKGCLYIRKLADVDMAVLEKLAVRGLAYLNATYPN